jgi:hypothetical protein
MFDNQEQIDFNKKKLIVKQDINLQGIHDSATLLDSNKVLEINEKEEQDSRSIAPSNITMDNLDLMNRQKAIIGASFNKGEQPREGEERDWKDGKYRFISGHWKKVDNLNKEEDLKKQNEKYKSTEEYIKGDKLNFNFDNKNYKVEFIEEDNNLAKVKLLEEIEIVGRNEFPVKIKPGTIFRIGKNTLSKI